MIMWGEELGLLCFVLFSVALCRWHEVFISMAFETKWSPRRRSWGSRRDTIFAQVIVK
jgi:hypothetical protein